jgi:hypothetical protein
VAAEVGASGCLFFSTRQVPAAALVLGYAKGGIIRAAGRAAYARKNSVLSIFSASSFNAALWTVTVAAGFRKIGF